MTSWCERCWLGLMVRRRPFRWSSLKVGWHQEYKLWKQSSQLAWKRLTKWMKDVAGLMYAIQWYTMIMHMRDYATWNGACFMKFSLLAEETIDVRIWPILVPLVRMLVLYLHLVILVLVAITVWPPHKTVSLILWLRKDIVAKSKAIPTKAVSPQIPSCQRACVCPKRWLYCCSMEQSGPFGRTLEFHLFVYFCPISSSPPIFLEMRIGLCQDFTLTQNVKWHDNIGAPTINSSSCFRMFRSMGHPVVNTIYCNWGSFVSASAAIGVQSRLAGGTWGRQLRRWWLDLHRGFIWIWSLLLQSKATNYLLSSSVLFCIFYV